jgi:hypothetical protein
LALEAGGGAAQRGDRDADDLARPHVERIVHGRHSVSLRGGAPPALVRQPARSDALKISGEVGKISRPARGVPPQRAQNPARPDGTLTADGAAGGTPMKRFRMSAVLVCLVVCMSGLRVAAEESQSAPPAAALKARMEQLKLDAVAARDPDEAGRYIAALYIPGVQLLVVSAPYPLASAIDKKIAARQFMDVYVDLQATRERAGHFFVEDFEADGLRSASDAACDTTTLNGTTPVVFNGKFEVQQLTQGDYEARLKRDDERYARMLKVLHSALARGTTAP